MKYLLGNKKTNLYLVNHLYKTPNEVEFIKIQEPEIEELVAHIKNLKEEVKRFYDGDVVLLQGVDDFTITVQRMLGTIKNYSVFLKEVDQALINFFNLTMHPTYKNLQETHVKPLIKVLKALRVEESNAYKTKINELLQEIKEGDKVVVVTRHRVEDSALVIEGRPIDIYRDKDLVKLGIFTDHLIFLGTPPFFDRKFSEMFFAKKTYFLGYSCFENSISSASSFGNLISKKIVINSVYKDVRFTAGHRGIDYRVSIKQPLEQYDEEKIVKRIESRQTKKGSNIQAKIIYISNNNYTLLPVDHSITTIDREVFKIQQTQIKNLETGDLLVFRTNNGGTLIKEVADDILGVKSNEMREQQDKWKRRLRSSIKKQGIDTVVRVLQNTYGISYVNKLNLSYWISPLCIKPDALEKILEALKFEEHERKEIMQATKEIYAAHIKAGRKISNSLMEEVNGHMEEVLGEKGYYKFESKIFAGASFNIEEIKAISKQAVMVSENDILKVYKN